MGYTFRIQFKSKGATGVRIRTTRHEYKRLTVNLIILKDANKLLPYVILDRKTLPKTRIHESKLFVATNGSNWINHETLEIWIKEVWSNYIVPKDTVEPGFQSTLIAFV